jgi:arabinogalactan oligomer/maltooligosaccharide transport system substrate-binding protein
MYKKILPIISIMMILAFVLAACGGGTTTTPAEEAPATEATEAPAAEEAATVDMAVTINLWHAYQTGSSEEATLTTLVANAMAAYPGLTINVLQVPFDQMFNKYQTEAAAGGGPDLFVAPNDSLGDFARAGLVAPLDDALAGRLDHYTQVGIDGMMVDGVMYGIPESAKLVALYYNTSLVATPPTTTDELYAAVEAGEQITIFVGAYHLFGWTGSFGGQLFDADSRCIADQGGWVEAANYLLSLKDLGAQFSADYGAMEAPFRAGETAYWPNGPWALADYMTDLGDNLGVVPLPAGPNGDPATPFLGIDGYYVNPNSLVFDQAVELGLYLTGQESAQIYTDTAGHIPVRDDVTVSNPLIQQFVVASQTGYFRPQTPEFSNFWTPFGDMWTQIIEGVATPEEAVPAACAAMNTANGK